MKKTFLEIFTGIVIGVGFMFFMAEARSTPVVLPQKHCAECEHDLEECQKRLYEHVTKQKAPTKKELHGI